MVVQDANNALKEFVGKTVEAVSDDGFETTFKFTDGSSVRVESDGPCGTRHIVRLKRIVEEVFE